MTTLMTPPLLAKGIYQVKAPFSLQPGALYTCQAIRSFKDLSDAGVDVLASYYTPVGLDQAALTADQQAGANIITLMSDTAPTVHLPDSYISAYPNLGNVAYSNVVLALSLGPLPDALDLTFAKQQVAEAAASVVGVEVTVTALVAPSAGVVTQEQADSAETARQAAITNSTSDAAKLAQLQAQYNDLNTRYAALQTWVVAHGGLPSS